MDEKLAGVYEEVARRNSGETEFLQAVREVLAPIGPVLAKRPEPNDHKTIQRICEPERQLIYRVPWTLSSGTPYVAMPCITSADTWLSATAGPSACWAMRHRIR